MKPYNTYTVSLHICLSGWACGRGWMLSLVAWCFMTQLPPGWCVMTQLPTRWSVSRPRTAEAAAPPALLALALKSDIRMREIVHLQAGQCGNQIGSKVCCIPPTAWQTLKSLRRFSFLHKRGHCWVTKINCWKPENLHPSGSRRLVFKVLFSGFWLSKPPPERSVGVSE